jgi:hypothetical protein
MGGMREYKLDALLPSPPTSALLATSFAFFLPCSMYLNNLLAYYFSEGLLALWTVEKADF